MNISHFFKIFSNK